MLDVVPESLGSQRVLRLYTPRLAEMQGVFGPSAVAVFLGSSLVAVLATMVVTYVAHYGLARRRLPSGDTVNSSAGLSWCARLHLCVVHTCGGVAAVLDSAGVRLCRSSIDRPAPFRVLRCIPAVLPLESGF